MNLLGAYIPGYSILHRMDPAVRMASFVVLFSSVIIASGFIAGYVFSALMIVFLFSAGKISLKPVFRSIWNFRVFFVTIFVMNAFFQPSVSPYFSWWFVTFSKDGIEIGLQMILTVILLTSLTTLLTSVATPISITDGLRTLLHPLSILHIPVDEASSIISMAISLIPVLCTESEAIMLSGRARGVTLGGTRIRDKAISLVPLIIPLFISAFRRADELSVAMESRGYTGKTMRRIKFHFGKREALSFLFSVFILAASIALKGVFR